MQAEEAMKQAKEASKRLLKAQAETEKLRSECASRDLSLQQLQSAYDHLTCRHMLATQPLHWLSTHVACCHQGSPAQVRLCSRGVGSGGLTHLTLRGHACCSRAAVKARLPLRHTVPASTMYAGTPSP